MDAPTVDHPRLLPGVLVPAEDGERRTRTTRDWIVDVISFVLCLLLGAGVLALEVDAGLDGLLALADVVLGVVALGMLWVRRRWPVALALLSVPIAAVSALGAFATGWLLFSLAVHRRWPLAVAVGALQVAASGVYFELHPDDDISVWVMIVVVLALTAATIAWGMFVRARRQLVVSLRDRARRAEAEQQLRVEQARQAERARIAREMHDVLAHRISLVSLHAGALEFRPDAPEEEIAAAAGIIRASAHQALADLREVIGVLRDQTSGGTPEPPQPTLAQLPGLLDESRAAGMRVHAVIAVEPVDAVPPTIGRSALRIVQEGLTNARKHAPGARVDVRVTGSPGDGLTVEVRNHAWVPAAASTGIPGAGTGLVGLTERAVLAGGRLEHGVTDEGEFRLHAWLPWS